MSVFQSGPYQSKVLRFVVRQTQRWIDQSSVALRSLKLTLSWSAQILLYPIYAAFQTMRLAGAKVQQGLELGSAGRIPTQPDVPEPPASPPAQPGMITADTPLEQVLRKLQALELPVSLPIVLPISTSTRSGLLPTDSTVGSGGTHPPSLSAGSTASLAHPDGSQMPAGDRSLVAVRGIATSLETRSLVLVTCENQILDILNPDQQAHLQQRIVWELAQYGRDRRIEQSTQRFLARLPIPAAAEWFLASKRTAQRCLNWIRPRPTPAIAGLNADLPIQQALLTVQEFSFSQPIPVLLPASAIPGTTAATVPRLPSSGELIRTEPNLMPSGAVAVPPVAEATVFIQGLATVLETRSLVLVTSQNQLLNILTAEQQAQIQQKIIWEVAHYGRYLQIRQTTHRALSRVHPSPDDSLVLPPVRAFQRLMAWVQSGPVAIAANVFQEASLPRLTQFTASSPTAVTPDASRPASIPSASGSAKFSWPRLSFSLPTLASSLLLTHATSGGAIALVPNFPLVASPASPSPARPAAAKRSARKPTLQLQTGGGAAPAIVPSTASSNSGQTPEYIDTQATPVGYVQPLGQQFLNRVDRVLVWLETQGFPLLATVLPGLLAQVQPLGQQFLSRVDRALRQLNTQVPLLLVQAQPLWNRFLDGVDRTLLWSQTQVSPLFGTVMPRLLEQGQPLWTRLLNIVDRGLLRLHAGIVFLWKRLHRYF